MAHSLRFRFPALRAAAVVAAALAGTLPASAASSTQAAQAAQAAVPDPPDVTVAAYVVADYDTGQILAERAPHRELYPASTLKVLTADTLIPRLASSLAVTPKPADFAAEPDGSVVGMTAGVTYTVADLWRATFLESANDAVAELAHLSGGLDATVALMQAKARALGADDTVVADADGYDADGQVTSAYDLAVLARAGLHIPAFRTYCALRQATFPGPDGKSIALKSHDPMLLSYPGMIGVKGGITTKAGHTYVGAATRDGRTVIETLMLGGDDIFDQAARLMDWGFAADGRVTPVGTLGGSATAPSTTTSPHPSATAPKATSPAPRPSPTTPGTPTTPTTPSQSSTSNGAAGATLTVIDGYRSTLTLSAKPGTPPADAGPGKTSSGPPVVLQAAARTCDPIAANALLWALIAAVAAAFVPLTVLTNARRRKNSG